MIDYPAGPSPRGAGAVAFAGSAYRLRDIRHTGKKLFVYTGHMFLLQITDGDSVANFDVPFFIPVTTLNYVCNASSTGTKAYISRCPRDSSPDPSACDRPTQMALLPAPLASPPDKYSRQATKSLVINVLGPKENI